MASVDVDERLDEDVLDLVMACDLAGSVGEAGRLLRLKGLCRALTESEEMRLLAE
jgi:hypothetical protein